MRYSLILLFLPVFMQCHNAQQTGEAQSSGQAATHLKKSGQELSDELVMDTVKPAMQRAWYEYDTEAEAPIGVSYTGFVVLADTSFKAAGFTSIAEIFIRHQAAISDTTISYYKANWVRPWKKLTARQRLTRVAREQAVYTRQADSLHTLNNHGYYRVWLLNNSVDTIALATQDESLVCILQAQNIHKQWQPVQLWHFSDCGNSNIARYLLPKESVSLLAKIPRHGNFRTTLRYKLAGTTQFYYSNEFGGYIDYGQFKESPDMYVDAEGVRRQSSRKSFKLDSLPTADYRGKVASPFRRGSKVIKLLPH